MIDVPPFCKTCQVERVKSRIDRGPRKGQWRDNCSRTCAADAALRHATGDMLRAANVQRARDARRTEIQQVFGDRLRRDGMISVSEAVELALRYGQKRYHAGYQAGHARSASLRRLESKQGPPVEMSVT